MTAAPTPEDVVRAVAAGVSRLMPGDLDAHERETYAGELADLHAERTNVVHPFDPLGGAPTQARDALRARFSTPNPDRRIESMASTDMVVHRTGDPEVVIAEFSDTGTADGKPFDLPCIFVVRVRDGVIIESRDYVDHVASARAFGQLGALASTLAEQANLS
jgi:ketosteroid isomerase-like protein